MQRQNEMHNKNCDICIRETENGEKSAAEPKWKGVWIISRFI
jgi:hypothetical protein